MHLRLWVVFASASASLSFVAACVGDDSNNSDASVQDSSVSDNFVASDSPAPNNDAGTDAPFIFDGANADCNALDPFQAPAMATTECADAAITVDANGGTIPPGRYYLSDEEFVATACTQNTGPFDDVVEIVALDGGSAYEVDVALSGAGSQRHTFLWTLSSPGHFTQTGACPSGGVTFNNAVYNVSVQGATTTIQYELPSLAEIKLTSF